MALRSMRISSPIRCFLALAGMFAGPVAAHADDGFETEIDLLEVHLGKGEDHLVLDSTFTLGAGSNQVVLKVEGGSDTRTAFDDFGIQALYSRKLSGSLAILGGVRHDFREGSDLTYGTVAIELELTPWLEGEHSFFFSQDGDLTGGAQLVASWNLSPRLTAEPRVALGWSSRDIPAEALGNGLTDIEISVRLRRQLGANVDVYVGAIHERLLGGTGNFARASGDPVEVTRGVVGAGLTF